MKDSNSFLEALSRKRPISWFNSGSVFYGWWILLLGCITIAVGSGVLYHGFSVFFLPLKRDLAISSAAVSLLYGAARLEGGFDGPLIGYLIDRFGPRRLMIWGAAQAGVGLILLSQVRSFWSFFLVYTFIVSLGFNAGFFHPVYAVINSWFIRHRGVAFSMTGAASSVGGMIMAPLLAYLIFSFGWRTAAVLAGIIILIIALPAALPIRRSPEILGLQPDGRPPVEKPSAGGKTVEPQFLESDFTVARALRSVDYWLLYLAIVFRVLVTVALTIHFVPLLVWKGMEERDCAYLVSVFAFGTIFTTLVSGWMGDRWPKSLLCSAGIIPLVAGMLILMLHPSAASVYALPIGLAVVMGTVPLNWALIGDLFGRLKYASLRGIIGIGNGLGTFLSPVFAGWVFDRSGSYSSVLLTFVLIHLVACVLFAVLYFRIPQRRF